MRSIVLIAFALSVTRALAADYPTVGMLYNQQEDSSLTYNCVLQQTQRLRCDFIQTAVRKKAKPADLDKKLADARKAFPEAVKGFSDPAQCGMVAAWLGMATGQISIDEALSRNPGIASGDGAKFKEGMLRLQEDAKANPSVLDTFRALAGMCDHPSEDNYLQITKADHEKDLRTCQVSSNPFTQEFVWVSDFGNGGAWVVSSQPEGPCGVVQLSRFEKDTAAGSGLFWRYTARKAATNPSGTLLLGLSCSAVDQGEYVYDWKKSRSDYMQCEFVEFSPI